MYEKTNTADRIRPFLRAMEQSIENARSQRVVAPRPRSLPIPAPIEAVTEATPAAPRMKARPKRTFLPS